MEIRYDDQNLDRFFYPVRRDGKAQKSQDESVFIVENRGVATALYSNGENLEEWVGASIEELRTHFETRDLVLVDQEKLDQAVLVSYEGVHFQDQMESLRSQLEFRRLNRPSNRFGRGSGPTEKLTRVSDRHFFLQAFQTWWSRFFPSSFGVLIQTEGAVKKNFFMLITRGRLDLYHEPDLSMLTHGLGPGRTHSPREAIRYLSEKHLVPVQGMVVDFEEWKRWSTSHHPWPLVWRALQKRKLRLIPFRPSLAFLVTLRAVFGI